MKFGSKTNTMKTKAHLENKRHILISRVNDLDGKWFWCCLFSSHMDDCAFHFYCSSYSFIFSVANMGKKKFFIIKGQDL